MDRSTVSPCLALPVPGKAHPDRRSRMPPLSPVRLISAATAFLGLGEESSGTGVGRLVSLCLAEVGQPPGHPWDTAFVHHVGYWSHYENEVDWSAWPLPRSA